jgi:hypothetical protein
MLFQKKRVNNMTDEENKAIDMLYNFITEHKLFNIKQADNLEDNIEKLLNLIEKQEKVIDYMVDRIEWLIIMLDFEHKDNFTKEDIKQYFYRKVENNE